MNKIVIITGANRGFGKAIVDCLSEKDNTTIVSLSRSVNEEHVNLEANKFIFIKTDLLEEFQISLADTLKLLVHSDSIIYCINNAGMILPIDPIGKLNQIDISKTLKVNVEYPLNLVNSLVKTFPNNVIEFVNVTSGAGINPIPYWSLYGASKAYMKMFFKVLMEEQKENNLIRFYDIDPGVLDTDMQKEIRESAAPKQGYFTSLKDENKLINPMDAVNEMLIQINF
jgi:benzil reductase ((S)-benzoin forming)